MMTIRHYYYLSIEEFITVTGKMSPHANLNNIRNLADAYCAYKKVTKSPSNSNTTERFFNFLGIKRDAKDISPEAEVKMNWLLSPHAETLYQAWKHKQEAS